VSQDIVKTGLQCSTLAEVDGVTKNPGTGLSSEFSRGITAAIINTHDVLKGLAQLSDNRAYYLRFVEQGNNDPGVSFAGGTPALLGGCHHLLILADQNP
jgi:hypothetical protein